MLAKPGLYSQGNFCLSTQLKPSKIKKDSCLCITGVWRLNYFGQYCNTHFAAISSYICCANMGHGTVTISLSMVCWRRGGSYLNCFHITDWKNFRASFRRVSWCKSCIRCSWGENRGDHKNIGFTKEKSAYDKAYVPRVPWWKLDPCDTASRCWQVSKSSIRCFKLGTGSIELVYQ